MYASIVTSEDERARNEGTSLFVYIPIKAVINIVRAERCCVKWVVDATRG